jgi:hypothetical protein
MHHHRCRAIPRTYKVNEPLHVFMRRRGIAIHRHGDVIDRKDEVVLRRDVGRPLDPIDKPQQSYDMAGAGLIDRGMKARK